MTGPSRVSPPRTWPCGVEVVGPLLRIPGRTLDTGQLEEAVRLADELMDAVAELRREFGPEQSG